MVSTLVQIHFSSLLGGTHLLANFLSLYNLFSFFILLSSSTFPATISPPAPFPLFPFFSPFFCIWCPETAAAWAFAPEGAIAKVGGLTQVGVEDWGLMAGEPGTKAPTLGMAAWAQEGENWAGALEPGREEHRSGCRRLYEQN
jgi:hypothetical protein